MATRMTKKMQQFLESVSESNPKRYKQDIYELLGKYQSAKDARAENDNDLVLRHIQDILDLALIVIRNEAHKPDIYDNYQMDEICRIVISNLESQDWQKAVCNTSMIIKLIKYTENLNVKKDVRIRLINSGNSFKIWKTHAKKAITM